MKYLHFMGDQFYSREFIDEIQSKFNIEEHHFIIINYKNKKPHINPEEYQNIKSLTFSGNILFNFFSIKDIKIRKLMNQAEYIFIHYLTEKISRILFRFKGKAKLLWVMWGADLYQYIPLELYDRHTSEILDYRLLSTLKRIYYSLHHEIRKTVIKNLDYVVSQYKGDIRLFKKYYKTKAEGFPHGIYINPVDFEKIDKEAESIDEKFNFKENGYKLLLLGNSGTPTNNHLDIMIRLSKMKEKNFRIICPLSYGSPPYIKKIVKSGKELFGDRFVPLLEFLSPDIYYHILKQIDLAIMYHNRQQAMGNIQILAYLGKPICMKKTSAFFYLVEKGVTVFSIQNLEELIMDEIEFTEDMSKKNKRIASQYFSEESTRSSIESLLNLLEARNTG
ncbi:MAG: TDP-N-acetylfucosamine:lipid II N-acetylfucosaminyltransferase [Promethearchaeota archaeon]|jgi:hypothetical protein